MNPYESAKLLNEYLLFHYGAPEEVLPWESGPASALDFAVRTVEVLFDWERVASPARALDVGCAVGRSSFELSKHCEEVVGIDFSQSFVDAAENLRKRGNLGYQRLEEGADWSNLEAKPPNGSKPAVIRFEQGDAMDLREDLGAFDLVHAANLLCRLSEPKRFLARLPDLMKPGGQLAITTPCTWLEEFTPRENWPHGTTLEFLRENLETAFDLVKTRDLPFLIREHGRKFQWVVSQGSAWRRHGGV